ncbi:MCE family protein [Actinomadura kijaniata]|uniref:MCE family protein n=1 Tax=Actinomadura kijaniata TaxID=46161 RepID=UPI00082C474D|nr:MCE family protein [Actinomadura kijaniata]
MLTFAIRTRIVVFVVLAVAVLGYLGSAYADLGRYVGMRGHYVVRLDLPATGGLFQGSAVSYRGVTVGKVGRLDLTRDGVRAELRIEDDAPRIPSALQAVVANRSAVGEQYVDLRPASDSRPYLEHGSQIPRSATTIPQPVHVTLKSVNDLAASLPLNDLRTLVDELGQAFAGQGPHLQTLLDTSSRFVAASDASFPETRSLIHNGTVVLRTQNEEMGSFKAFAANSRLLARTLRSADGDIRKIIADGPGTAREVRDLIRELDPGLPELLANLITVARLTDARLDGLGDLFANLPQAAAIGPAIVQDGRLRLGLVNTFFNPQPCTRGYGRTPYRNGLDTSPARGLNADARCTEAPGTGINVRGAANAPRGGVPAPARPGTLRDDPRVRELLGAAGLPVLGQPAATDLRGLLGLGGAR